MDNVIQIQSTPAQWSNPVNVEQAIEVGAFEPFVDEHVVARFLQITPRRVLEMARKKEIPAHPLGNARKTWRFRLSEIDAHFSTPATRQTGGTIKAAVPGTQERKRLG